MSSPRILGLILARGGSKRLPGKNVRMLAGKPLIAWSVEAAKACPMLEAVVVSTDDEAIAAEARRAGAEVPFLRPVSLADDHSTSEDAALHALDWLSVHQGRRYDAVLLVEPTSPLRASTDISAVAKMLVGRWDEADAVVAVGRVLLAPQVMKQMDPDGRLSAWLPPQQIPQEQAYYPFGGAYAVKTETLKRLRTFYPPRLLGYTVQRWQAFEVDDLVDFLCVEALMQHAGENEALVSPSEDPQR